LIDSAWHILIRQEGASPRFVRVSVVDKYSAALPLERHKRRFQASHLGLWVAFFAWLGMTLLKFAKQIRKIADEKIKENYSDNDL